MAATGVNLNWTAVSFSSQSIVRVNSVSINRGGGLIKYSGDNDRWPTVAAIGVNNPTASISTADVGTAWLFDVGQYGVFTATLLDARSATGGNVVFSSTGNGVCADVQSNGAHAQFAGATINIDFIAPDGATNPLSVGRV